ncbi:ATP-binding protein [Thiomicrorhabdus sp.]|uniref:sensor histidine kinase n=1 Tax=Thiomicrorhabdus sp. TaxID=2039724 RepID=UPI0029C8C954|nr:ATP-binding protein [Thiomicrorhabdus sp.]
MSTLIARYLKQYGWITLLSGVLLISLVIMSQILQNASSFAESYSALLFFTFGGVFILLIVLVRTLWSLLKQYKKRIPGIKITIRLTFLATLLMGLPTATIYYFSLSFIQQGINQWFDVKTEVALENASTLVRITLDNKTRESLNRTLSTVKEEHDLLANSPIIGVSRLRNQLGAQEISFYHANQQLIAFSSPDGSDILPTPPGDNLFQQVRQKITYAAIETRPGATVPEQFIRVVVPFTDTDINTPYVLQAIYTIPSNITELAESVSTASGQYKELSYLKAPLTTSFTLILTIVLLLTLLTAILFTIQAVQNFARPIRTLARGTKAISKGDYSIKMPVKEHDEFGELIASFNDMTQRIAQARNEIKMGQHQAEVQKLYLQAIIQNLSSGVITLDMKQRIRTMNDAAKQILNADLSSYTGRSLKEAVESRHNAHLSELFEQITPHFDDPGQNWNLQKEFSCKDGQKRLLIHGSTLPGIDTQTSGYVIVMDDITELVQAQLHAAWSDVARRLAHEIKNPLTPIQLSAERLKFKLHDKLQDKDQSLLTRMTQTIIEQVNTMQTLVQAFSDYANTPEVKLSRLDLNSLIKSIVDMYYDPKAPWQVKAQLDPKMPFVAADPARLRQLFHNLIKNSLEATESQEYGLIEIRTEIEAAEQVRITVCDNGPGIPEQHKNWIFEPYATDKPKGTGLGLAVVRKIVDEHHGQIQLKSSPQHGTCFIIKLPLTSRERE